MLVSLPPRATRQLSLLAKLKLRAASRRRVLLKTTLVVACAMTLRAAGVSAAETAVTRMVAWTRMVQAIHAAVWAVAVLLSTVSASMICTLV